MNERENCLGLPFPQRKALVVGLGGCVCELGWRRRLLVLQAEIERRWDRLELPTRPVVVPCFLSRVVRVHLGLLVHSEIRRLLLL